MTSVQMPGGGKAWFVRTRGRWCGLRAVSREAHWLSGAFAGWVGAIGWFVSDGDFGWLGVAAAMMLTFLGAFFYILIALRMSAPAPKPSR
jgi:hypothetical protein